MGLLTQHEMKLKYGCWLPHRRAACLVALLGSRIEATATIITNVPRIPHCPEKQGRHGCSAKEGHVRF